MGASLGSPSPSGGRRSRRHAKAGFNDINVTPMVDVMLVLLIIFMVTAPMLTTGVNVDLPKTAAAPIQGNDEKLVISVNRQGEIFLAKSKVTLDELRGRLSAIATEKKDTQVLVKGDKSVDYGLVMKVLGEINSAGLTKVGLQSDPTGAGSRL